MGERRFQEALSERIHRCGVCGPELDRDENAARNVLSRGLCASSRETRQRVGRRKAPPRLPPHVECRSRKPSACAVQKAAPGSRTERTRLASCALDSCQYLKRLSCRTNRVKRHRIGLLPGETESRSSCSWTTGPTRTFGMNMGNRSTAHCVSTLAAEPRGNSIRCECRHGASTALPAIRHAPVYTPPIGLVRAYPVNADTHYM